MEKNILELQSNLDKIRRTVFREYLYNVSNEFVVYPFALYNTYKNSKNEDTKKIVPDVNIQCIHIERWVYDKKEQIIDRFANVYSAFSQRKDAIAMLVNRTIEGADFYFVIRSDSSQGGNRTNTNSSLDLLMASIKGNFPGTIVKKMPSVQKELIVKENGEEVRGKTDIWGLKEKKAISAITSISSDKSEKHISQGLEKVLSGIIPKERNDEYTLVFLAEPVSNKEIKSIKNGYESLASGIYSYSEYQSNETLTETATNGTSWTTAHTTGTNRSIAKTRGVNAGVSGNLTTSAGWFWGIIDNFKKANSSSVGGNIGFQYSRTTTEGSMMSDTDTEGINHCISNGALKGETHPVKSYPIADMLKRIEKQIERLDECEGVGMWKNATYVLAGNKVQAESVAHFLLGLIQGKESFVEASVVNTWAKADNNAEFNHMLEYICNFCHPLLVNVSDIAKVCEKRNLSYNTKVNEKSDVVAYEIEPLILANQVTSIELAMLMAFPYKSVKGLSCVECAEFERNVLYKDIERFATKGVEKDQKEKRQFNLGEIYHMHEFDGKDVPIDVDELTKHTFITGSTGSGKSTTVYKMLHELYKDFKIPFLVIEPAKGEYHKEFANIANVYSTNSNHGELLRINPFYFPAEGENRIFVSEHIDRLNEIFNVCWPMYAAMPAVLKEALEAAYEEAGWDLTLSVNCVSNKLFPTFDDLFKQLKRVISVSDFSEEVKSNYTGSLITRVRSLTNGIYRQIFTSDGLDDDELFEENVIVDISRIGAPETKALIMGMLVMRMQEYHMANSEPVDELKHITVLEEAHNLLKKTSTEQSSESSNIQGKSVEMISNAIAEMRTYGEGFVIADQAPGLLDESVIRNTNTKIIMSLPDFSDRELVGKAVGLSDEQVVEITRLPKGKAVVYQNNWVAPVLCAVKAIDKEENLEEKNNVSKVKKDYESEKIKATIVNAVLHNKLDDISIKEVEGLHILNVPAPSKKKILMNVKNKIPFNKQDKIEIINDFYATDFVKNVMLKTEGNIEIIQDNDIEALKAEFQRWVEALGVTEQIETVDLMGIINIILYKIEQVEQIELIQCERLFSLAEYWR